MRFIDVYCVYPWDDLEQLPNTSKWFDHWGLFCGSHITRIEHSLVNLNYLAPVI